jgi:hypothetical protein
MRLAAAFENELETVCPLTSRDQRLRDDVRNLEPVIIEQKASLGRHGDGAP